MKSVIVSLESRFNYLKPKVKKSLAVISRALKIKNGQVEVYLVGNKFMKKNVLAFPAPKHFPRPDLGGRKFLGEIYLNPVYIENNREKFLYMVIHGFLHLLGYDHKKESDRIKMEKTEKRLLALCPVLQLRSCKTSQSN